MMLGCKRLNVKSSAPVPLAIFPYSFRVIIEGAVEGTSGSVWISRNEIGMSNLLVFSLHLIHLNV